MMYGVAANEPALPQKVTHFLPKTRRWQSK